MKDVGRHCTRQTSHGRTVNTLVALKKNATKFPLSNPNFDKIIELLNPIVW
jgi:hypothetical protein